MTPLARTRRSCIERKAPWLGLALVGLVAGLAWAQGGGQEQAVANSTNEVSGITTLVDLYLHSPVINGIIAALSVLALGLFLFFLSTVNTRSMVPAEFVDQVTKLAVQGKFEQAADLCRGNRNVFVASIVQRCVENAGKGHSVIMDMIDAEGRRRADIVWNRISYLADVSNVAPMLGLLGTVIGMIRMFFSMPTISGASTAEFLAAGIGQAMTTTMFGLGVGILALLFYSIVKARVTRTLADAEQAVHSIADHIKREEGAQSSVGE
jgi:biopolymer transport protein ExbB